MSDGINYLHSHSELERNLPSSKDKFHVLVDEEYKELFPKAIPYKYNGVQYYWVDTYYFYMRGGIFKNLRK